jgi:hypothetical protein
VRLGDRERRERFDRDQLQFDRMFRIVFPIALVLGVLGAVVSIALYAAGAAWIWSVIP